jgi:hypothetical protein
MRRSLKAKGFFDVVLVNGNTGKATSKRRVNNMVGAYALADISNAMVSNFKGTGWKVVGIGTSSDAPNAYDMTALGYEVTEAGYARKTISPTTNAVGQLQLVWSYQSSEWYGQSVGEAGIFMNDGAYPNIRARATFPQSNKTSETQILFTYQVNFRTQ